MDAHKSCSKTRKLIKIYMQAIKDGDHSAFLSLGNLFWRQKEVVKAGIWLNLGARSGEPGLVINYIYFLTKYTDPSRGFREAREWLEKLLTTNFSSEGINNIVNKDIKSNLWEKNERIAEWFYNQADRGNRDAQYCLALLYSRGIGVEKNEAKARELFDLAEFGSDPEAYLKLGQSYENGIDRNKDYQAAKRCYEKTIELGNRLALLNLAKLYANGFGVIKNYEKAWECVHQAFLADKTENSVNIKNFIHENKIEISAFFKPQADFGNSQAQLYYGLLFHNGYGVDKNEDNAKYWIKRSADQGNKKAQQFFGFYEIGAEEGDPEAQLRLGLKYATDKYLHPKNIQKAREWLDKSAQQGLAEAQFQLGKLYAGELQDGNMAIKWLEEAIKNGHKEAHYELGLIYYYGNGLAPNYELAEKEFKFAAEAGYKKALLGLGLIYKNITHEYGRAFKCFEDSIEDSFFHHNYKGLYEIETMLKEGLLTPKEQEKAQKLRFEIDIRQY